jgi:hypothetical protein
LCGRQPNRRSLERRRRITLYTLPPKAPGGRQESEEREKDGTNSREARKAEGVRGWGRETQDNSGEWEKKESEEMEMERADESNLRIGDKLRGI